MSKMLGGVLASSGYGMAVASGGVRGCDVQWSSELGGFSGRRRRWGKELVVLHGHWAGVHEWSCTGAPVVGGGFASDGF